MTSNAETQHSRASKTESLWLSGGLPRLGWLVLLLTACISATWSAHKLLAQDEIFSLQTDRVSTFHEVLRIQRSFPISLEPPLYHLLAHAAMISLGPTAFALRLPSLLGYLLMQFCLYFFVRNLIGEDRAADRAGLIAMTLPALTWTLFYSAEGRPYGALLGAYTAAALCWQIAGRRKDTGEARSWPLTGLAVALAFTLNVHFYGVLLLIAVYGAEFVRSVQRRKLDVPMVSVILLATCSLIATLPYVTSSSEFKKHYYAGPVSTHMLTQPYRQMLLDYTSYSKSVQVLILIVFLVAGLVVGAKLLLIAARHETATSRAEWTMILLLVAMPVFAFALGKLVTHALEARHSIGAIVGISSLLGIALFPNLRQERTFIFLLTAMLIGCVVVNGARVRASSAADNRKLAELRLSPALSTAIETTTDHKIYFQNLGEWETASLYEPDPNLRSRLVLIYSRDEEMRYEQHDTMFLTATHTQKFSSQPIMSYDELKLIPGDHIFATYAGSGWDWIDAAFARESAKVTPLGTAFGGNLVKVRFRQ